MNRDDMLRDAIAKNTDPIFMTNPGDIMEYYKDTYPGYKTNKKGETVRDKQGNPIALWRTKIASGLVGIAKNKKGKKMTLLNTPRRYQSNREQGTASPKSKSEYAALGKKLPPIGQKLRNGEITLTVKGKQDTGKRGGSRDREITVTLKGSAAFDFISNPNFPDFWDAFMPGGADLFEDGEYAIEVTSVE